MKDRMRVALRLALATTLLAAASVVASAEPQSDSAKPAPAAADEADASRPRPAVPAATHECRDEGKVNTLEEIVAGDAARLRAALVAPGPPAGHPKPVERGSRGGAAAASPGR